MSRATPVDVAIVGGGVAGASLAAVLARAGLGVVVIERERRFRDRVRGEGLHPWGYREAKALGLDPILAAAGAVELPIWQTYQDRQPAEPYRWETDEVNQLPEVTVPHPALQDAMLRHAAACGARVVRPARVAAFRRGLSPELEVVSAAGAEVVRPRLIVGADGRRSMVRRWLGARVEQDPPHHLIGGGLLGGVDLSPESTHAASFPGGRMFTFPQGGGRARVYVVASTRRGEPLRADRSGRNFVRFAGELLPPGALESAQPIGPIAFFPNADVWSSRLAGDDIALIGDAAGANDPSLGQGLSLVFRDVRELSERLLSDGCRPRALAEYATRREADFAVLRAYARWMGPLVTDEGAAADERRARVERAREVDPTAAGYAFIFSRGPAGLRADEETRCRVLGEDLP